MNQFQTAAEVSLLTTFLGDEDIRQLARDPKFQSHLVSQKSLIASLLKDSFQILEGSSASFASRPTEPKIEVAAPLITSTPFVETSVAPTSVSPSAANVLSDITQIVAEKTGYPVDMLDPDMDLEADLGIDTIKQMEIMGVVREKFKIKPDKNFNLRQASSLRAIENLIRSAAG